MTVVKTKKGYRPARVIVSFVGRNKRQRRIYTSVIYHHIVDRVSHLLLQAVVKMEMRDFLP